MLISEGIEPKLEASRYLDKEDNENELKQVLGDTTAAYNLTPDDVLIIGKNGMLISGPNSRCGMAASKDTNQPQVLHASTCKCTDKSCLIGTTRCCWCSTWRCMAGTCS